MARVLLRSRWVLLLAAALILALAAFLRFTNVGDNPGWYTDEATHVDIARHLQAGRIQYMAVNQSVLLFARPPLFHLALAGWFTVFGAGIESLRSFTAALGVGTVALLMIVTRRTSGSRSLALLSGLLLAVYPQAVLYSRLGFSYNLLAPLLLLTLLGLWGYLRSGRPAPLVLAAVAVGLGITGDLMALMWLPGLALAIIARRPRALLWALPLAALPAALYTAFMLLRAPDAFLFDLRFTFGRLSALPLRDQIGNIALNYTVLLSQDFWTLAGVIGLFLLRPARLRALALLLWFVPLVLMGRTVALYSLSAYYMIPLLPLIPLGAAALIRRGGPHLARVARGAVLTLAAQFTWSPRMLTGAGWIGVWLAALLVVLSPLGTTAALLAGYVQTHYPTAIDPFLINPDDARRAADYVNARASADDVVIASPAVAWQLTARAADFQMAAAALGFDTPHLPGSLPPERWAFDPHLQGAAWVIVDNLWRNWGAVHIPAVAIMLQDVERWPLAFESGALRVYRSPAP